MNIYHLFFNNYFPNTHKKVLESSYNYNNLTINLKIIHTVNLIIILIIILTIILIINLTIYILILAIPINRNYRKIFLPFRFNKDH